MTTAEIVRVNTPTFAVQRAGRQNVGEYTMIASDTDDQRIVEMWINRKNRSENTKEQYRLTWRQFHEAIPLPLQAVTYNDLADWVEMLEQSNYEPTTLKTKISIVRSLFSFGLKTGYLRVNPGAMLEVPKTQSAIRILSEAEFFAMLAATKSQRNKVLLRVLYSSGARISELLALTWRDVIPVADGKAVLRVYGKGGKTREAGISAATYKELLKLRSEAGNSEPVFKSNRGTALDRSMALRIIKQSAEAAGIENYADVSPHWLRHSHVSHALERGANPEAVRQQVGHSSLAITTAYAHTSSSSADVLAV